MERKGRIDCAPQNAGNPASGLDSQARGITCPHLPFAPKSPLTLTHFTFPFSTHIIPHPTNRPSYSPPRARAVIPIENVEMPAPLGLARGSGGLVPTKTTPMPPGNRGKNTRRTSFWRSLWEVRACTCCLVLAQDFDLKALVSLVYKQLHGTPN
jgi:hypothetical protein